MLFACIRVFRLGAREVGGNQRTSILRQTSSERRAAQQRVCIGAELPSEMTVGGPSCEGQPRLPHGGRVATLAALGLARQSINASLEQWQSRAEPVAVPKILHQTWKNCTLPWRQAFWREECRRVLPGDWTLLLHTDEDNRAFMAREFPDYLDLYDGYELSIQRVDAVRYFYLYRYGGVYMDLDFTCLRPLEELPLTAGRVSLGFQHPTIQTIESVANAFMVAPPRHPFIAMLIERLRETAGLLYNGKPHPMRSTGCSFLTKAVRAAALAPGLGGGGGGGRGGGRGSGGGGSGWQRPWLRVPTCSSLAVCHQLTITSYRPLRR